MNKPAKNTPPKIQKRTGSYIFGSIVLVILVVGILALLSNQSFSAKKTVTNPDYGTKVLGADTTSDKYKLKVNHFETLQASEAGSNQYRVRVNVSITNTSNGERQISPLLQMHILDQSGTPYDMTADYQKDQIIGGPLSSVSTFNGDIDFNMPQTQKPQTFTFQLEENSKKQSFTLN